MASDGASRSRRTKEAIFAAAEDLFLQHGFSGTSMDAVAEQAGVTKQTVYAHVGDKETLFLDVVDTMTSGAGDVLGDSLIPLTGDTHVERYLEEFAARQLEIVMTPRLMKLRRMVIGEHVRFPALGEMLHRRGPGRSIARLAEVVDHFVEKGELRAADPSIAASFFNWLVMGGPTNDAMLLGDRSFLDAAARRTHSRESVRIFMAAYGS